MTAQKATALILCHDTWSEFLDRRICQQAALLAEAGYIVSLACFTRNAQDAAVSEQASSLDTFRRLGFNGSLLLTSYSKCRDLPDSLFGIPSKTQSLRYRKTGYLVFAALRLAQTTARILPLPFFSLVISRLGWMLSGPLSFDAPLIEAVLSEQQADTPFELSASSLVIACDTTTARAGLLLKEKYGCTLWFDMHEYYSQQCVFPPATQSRLFAVEKHMIFAADRAYTVNPLLADLISRDAAGQVSWLSNYLDSDPSSGLHKLTASKDSREQINLIFHGGAGPNRNIDKLIRAFSQLRDKSVHITFLQSGMSTRLRRIAERSDNIHVSDYVRPEVLDVLLRKCDGIVVPYPPSDPNNTYCSPNKLGDAIALSIPVLFNSELRYLSYLANQSSALVPLDFSSVKALTLSLAGIASRLRDITAEDFEALSQTVGAEPQKKLYNTWIQQLAE